MLKSRVLHGVCAVAMMAGLAPAIASAQPADKRTYFTFSGPVDMPGVALPAGRYVFRLANPDTSRNVVQVASADGRHVYGMFFSHPAERNTAANDAEVRFMEASAGAPAAVKTWWYPGERTGYEFIYPKNQARRIAERTHHAVLTTQNDTTTTKETDATALTRVAPGGTETQITTTSTPAEASPSGSAQTGQLSDSVTTPVGTVARARTQLPQTASTSPLVALIGSLMLAAAALLKFRTAENS